MILVSRGICTIMPRMLLLDYSSIWWAESVHDIRLHHHYCAYSSGAGKTTTFSILTGDISPTNGTASIAGFDIRTDLRKVGTGI